MREYYSVGLLKFTFKNFLEIHPHQCYSNEKSDSSTDECLKRSMTDRLIELFSIFWSETIEYTGVETRLIPYVNRVVYGDECEYQTDEKEVAIESVF